MKSQANPRSTSSAVSRPTAAASDEARRHFERLLQFETDCWDVHHAISNGRQDFVLLDVRGEALFGLGHIEGAINLPHGRINDDSLGGFADATLFVVYCAGPHCNGADKAAVRLAKLHRPVKKMIGGITGWIDEGFSLVTDVTTTAAN
ncbi:MAG: rhodanese [Gammaproteobacteria bacterium]|nr:rhodanese [Gammaproteobacteria bacterium]|tara:strand:+ start:2103 stop:2546 length:444 start_codon:yes stop_codon:yes gene_type:complete